MSRTHRFLHGLRLGYLNQLVTVAVGIWLTPFLLSRLGEGRFGVWLAVTQLLGYLTLLDLGIIALVPRETAFAVGRGGGVDETREVAPVLGRTLRLVAWQLPVLVVASSLLWLLLPSTADDARTVLLPILGVFVACWPFRVFMGALEGLQQFRFTGMLQMGAWTAQTITVVTLVASGLGLASLAWGWGVMQVTVALGAITYLAMRFPQHMPRSLPRVSLGEAKEQAARGLWITTTQLTSVLLYGSDVLLIARVAGPAAAVPYAMTAKLVSVLQNQPQILMHSAMPALSELTAAGERARVVRVVGALSVALLVASGGIATVVTLVNEGFVHAWVGAARFGGMGMTLAIVSLMIVRHWSLTMNYANFALGKDRAVSLVNLADGVVTLVGSIVLIHLVGPIGAPLASLTGACLVGIPFSLRLLSGPLGTETRAFLKGLRPLAWRLPLLIGAAALVASRWSPRGVIELALAATGAAVVYALVMLPVVGRSPLAHYVFDRMPAPVARILRALARLAPEPRAAP